VVGKPFAKGRRNLERGIDGIGAETDGKLENIGRQFDGIRAFRL
jgi:hypothetical protein